MVPAELLRRASELYWMLSDRARVMWANPALRREISGSSLAAAAASAGQIADALVVAYTHATQLGLVNLLQKVTS